MASSSALKSFSDADIADTIWVEYRDEKKDRPYYYNKETNTTTWKLPPDYAEWRASETRKFMNERGITSNSVGEYEFGSVEDGNADDCAVLMARFQQFLTSVTVARKKSKRKLTEAPKIDDKKDGSLTTKVDGKQSDASKFATGQTGQRPASAAVDDGVIEPTRKRLAVESTEPFPVVSSVASIADLLDQKEELCTISPLGEQSYEQAARQSVTSVAPTPVSLHITYEDALKAVESPDSIMNKSIADNIKVAIKLSPDGSSAPTEIVTKLTNNYVGFAQMVNWTMEINKLAHTLQASHAEKQQQKQSQQQLLGQPALAKKEPPYAYDANQAICAFLISQIKSRFSSDVADRNMCKVISSLVSTSSQAKTYSPQMPSWLEDMMDDSTFRKMLIELYDSFKSCQFLGVCLQRMSYKGYHK
jgi:hypothetical protein